MNHLTSDELLDAAEGTLDPARQQHLDTCDACRQQAADLATVLGEALAVAVPEPSPLFWSHLSERVRTAIDAEPQVAGGWRQWMRWPVLAPIGALALLVLTLGVALPRPQAMPAAVAIATEPAETDSTDRVDEGFALVADLVGDLDWDTAMLAGLGVAPGAADLAVLDLTATEQQELTRLLMAELTRAKS